MRKPAKEGETRGGGEGEKRNGRSVVYSELPRRKLARIKEEDGEGRKRKERVVKHTDLEVYGRAFEAAMQVFEVSKSFPREERYSLTDQGRRSSRSVCANIAEAWRKRRYKAAFVSKLSDAEGEAAETQVWLQFAVECKYLDRSAARKLYAEYDAITAMLVHMINHPTDWTIR